MYLLCGAMSLHHLAIMTKPSLSCLLCFLCMLAIPIFPFLKFEEFLIYLLYRALFPPKRRICILTNLRVSGGHKNTQNIAAVSSNEIMIAIDPLLSMQLSLHRNSNGDAEKGFSCMNWVKTELKTRATEKWCHRRHHRIF